MNNDTKNKRNYENIVPPLLFIFNIDLFYW